MEQCYAWLLEVALLILLAKLLEALFVRLGLARILAYLTLGVIVATIRHGFGFEISDVTIALANIGIIALLFQAGLESSLRRFIRSLKETGIVALGGVIGALVAGLSITPILGRDILEAFALGVILSATSISVTVKTLEELGALSSSEAQVIIGAAVVDDVIGLALLSILYGISSGSMDPLHTLVIPLLAFLFWFATAWIANRWAPNLFKFVLRLRLEAGIISLSFAMVLLLAYVASTIGLSTILLAYAFGLGIAGFRHAARRIEDSLKVITSIFTPLFFIYVGSRVDIEQILLSEPPALLTIAITVVILAIVSKIVGCYAAARILKLKPREALVIGIGMVPRAEVALVAATVSLERGLLTHDLFVGVLLSIPVTLFLTPVLLRYVYTSMTS